MPENKTLKSYHLGIVKMALRNCIKDIHFADTLKTRRVHGDLMNDISRKVQYIGSKYNVPVEPLYFEWDKLTSTLERQFSDVLNEMLNDGYQGLQSDQYERRSITPRSRELS